MSTQIIVNGSGSSFAGSGLGNVNPAQDYITLAGITDANTITALRTAYTSLETKGLLGLIDAMYIFFAGDTAQKQRYNFINPNKYPLTFYNDLPAYHTAQGYVTSAYVSGNVPYATSNYRNTTMLNMHVSAWNTAAETGSGSLAGTQLSPNRAFVARSTGGQRQGAIGLNTSSPIAGSAVAGETGVLTVSRDSDTHQVLYKDSALLTTQTTSAGLTNVLIDSDFGVGGIGNGIGGATTGSKTTIAFASIGKALTLQQEADKNTILNTLKVAILGS